MNSHEMNMEDVYAAPMTPREPHPVLQTEPAPEPELPLKPEWLSEPEQAKQEDGRQLPAIDRKQIAKWVKKIRVQNLLNADVEVENRTPLVMIGKGRQGAVFQIGEDTCMKVFGNQDDCEREHYALLLGQSTNLVPRVYVKGPNYIVMELIKGISLRDYLEAEPLTKELSRKLIEMLVTFQKIGYERIDHHKRQIYLQPDGSLKVIDVARTVWRDRTYPYPRKLLTSLGKDYREVFLSHVQEMAPELYEEWKHYMKMDEMARRIYRVVRASEPSKGSDARDVKKLSKSLLTTHDDKVHYAKLEELVRKVWKEEWVKDLIVQGRDPEKIKKEIDQYLKLRSKRKKAKEKKKK
ncbi:protein kinase family protein [Effusibacillus pohliae]|uniref:hypothetical protein n=1 Tax=Effusibacillus pohliae TaxID=232270 RepID=UPI00035F5C08|nr:hypothetical protein [Effusibacillus pohliae]